MCDLSQCSFLGSYDTNFCDDIVNEFYNPALTNTIYYDRMSGFFSSSSLAVSAKGIVNLINNNGKMRLLTCPILSEKDAEIISQCLDDSEELSEKLSSIVLKSVDVNFLSNEATEALGWMLLKGYLEIRIVLVKDDDGFLSSKQIDNSGIFHNKVGIMKDDHGNIVTFSGSINESIHGWTKNIESFEVFCSWEDGAKKHIAPHLNRFEDYWQLGTSGRSYTISFPDAVKNEWIKSIPDDKKKLKIMGNNASGISLREYQTNAIQNWASNAYRGIFSMATGTGKTITALFALSKLVAEIKANYILVVVVPNQHLIPDPWVKSLKKYIYADNSKNRIIQAFSGNKKWTKELSDAKMDYRLKILDSICIVTTYDTLSSDNFISIIKSTSGKKILIADEVHNSGADTFSHGLLEDYDYRLGLSATPARYLDDDGTQTIYDYFEGEVFSFSLDEAIHTINPDTNKTYLTPYYYHPIFVSLNDDELNLYNEYSSKIVRSFSIENPTPEQIKYREKLLINRSRIGKNAVNKMSSMANIVPQLKNEGFFDHCLIYCSDGRDPEDHTSRSINSVIEILNNNKILNRRFTSDDAFSTRSEILDDFANGNVSTLVAIKCLDEGVDVPATKNAIVMASTGNPREYIQRRGRILRPSIGKEYAVLYDFIIIPSGSEKYRDAEHNLFNTEYRRFREFSDSSLNKEENEVVINAIISKYDIELEDFE